VALATLCLLLAVLYLKAEVQAVGGLGFPLDDSWIHVQFASSVAEGKGLAYRGDQLVTGSTAPLWTAVLSLLFLIPLPIVLTAKILGVALLVLAAIELERLGRELELPTSLRYLTLVLFLFTDWMVWSAFSGMEILLFVWLSLAACARHLEEKRQPLEPARSLVLFALAALARPEGLLLLVLALWDRFVVWRFSADGLDSREQHWQLPGRSLALGMAAGLLVVGTVLAIQFSIGGSPFPQTLRVKTDGVRQLWPSLRHVFQAIEILFRPQPFMALLAGGGALQLLVRLGTKRDRGLLPAVWLFSLPLAYATMAAPGRPMPVGNFGRYLFPLFPFLIVLGAVALEPVLQASTCWLRGRRVRTLVLAIVSLVLVLPSLGATLGGSQRSARNVLDVESSDVAAAYWIRDNLPKDAKLGVQDVGAIAFLTENPLVDMAGIVTPEILPYVKGDLRGSHRSGLEGLIGYLRREQVDFLVLFPESYGGLETLALLEPNLRPIYRRQLDGNITMAGSNIAILATPWGRYRAAEQVPPGDNSP
jgi:hypothetical protein